MNMDKPDIQTTKKLLHLRTFLDNMSQLSYSFSVLNRQFPMNTMTQKDAEEVIKCYEELIDGVRSLVKNENEYNDTST